MGKLNHVITVTCSLCHGTGQKKSDFGEMVPCVLCSGTGRMPMSETGPPTALETLFSTKDEFESREEIGIPGAVLLLLQTGFANIRNTNSDRGALVAGIVAGLAVSVVVQRNLPALLSFSLENFNGPPIVVFLALLTASGLVAGATAALLWAVFADRRQLPGLRLGVVGGTLTAVAGFVLMPLVRLYGPGMLVGMLVLLATMAIGAAIKRLRG